MVAYRVKMRWSGFNGGPGYSILHFDAATTPTQEGAQAVYDHASAFAQNIASNVPSVVKVGPEAQIEVIDVPTNTLVDVYNVTSKADFSGINTSGFSSATGACIIWETGEIRNGRRVRGRTFIVPMAANGYDSDGTLTAAALTDLQQAASALAAGGFQFGILARPSIKGAADGSFHTVSSGRVTDKTAILRSRRD